MIEHGGFFLSSSLFFSSFTFWALFFFLLDCGDETISPDTSTNVMRCRLLSDASAIVYNTYF